MPPLQHTTPTFFVRVPNLAATILKFVNGFWDKGQQERTKFLSGNDAFAHASFESIFWRSSIPADIGGDFRAGSDGHCCAGVALPKVRQGSSMWNYYEQLRKGAVAPSVLTHG